MRVSGDSMRTLAEKVTTFPSKLSARLNLSGSEVSLSFDCKPVNISSSRQESHDNNYYFTGAERGSLAGTGGFCLRSRTAVPCLARYSMIMLVLTCLENRIKTNSLRDKEEMRHAANWNNLRPKIAMARVID